MPKEPIEQPTETAATATEAVQPLTPEEPAPNAQALEEVQLTAPHTHAGRDYLSGEKLQVTADVKQWLVEHNKIKVG